MPTNPWFIRLILFRILSERQRIVIDLYYWQRLTFREIGERFGVSGPRARMILIGAIDRLWRRWQGDKERFISERGSLSRNACAARKCVEYCERCGRRLVNDKQSASRICVRCSRYNDRHAGDNYFSQSAVIQRRCGLNEDDYSEESMP